MEKAEAPRPAFDLARIDQAEKVPRPASRKATIAASKVRETPNDDDNQGYLWPEARLAKTTKVDAKSRPAAATTKSRKPAKTEPLQCLWANGLKVIKLQAGQIENYCPPLAPPAHYCNFSSSQNEKIRTQHLLQVIHLDGVYKIVSGRTWAATILNGLAPTDDLLVILISNAQGLSLEELREEQTAAEWACIPPDWAERLPTISAGTLNRIISSKSPKPPPAHRKEPSNNAGEKKKREVTYTAPDSNVSAARLHILVEHLCSVRTVQQLLSKR